MLAATIAAAHTARLTACFPLFAIYNSFIFVYVVRYAVIVCIWGQALFSFHDEIAALRRLDARNPCRQLTSTGRLAVSVEHVGRSRRVKFKNEFARAARIQDVRVASVLFDAPSP